MSEKPILKLDWCSYAAAKYACEHWHYSRCLIATITRPVYIGVWENAGFIGTLVFSHGVNKNIGSPYGLTQFECCELVRVALTAHYSQVTRMVAIAIRMIARQSPGLRMIVSYADSGEGHHGGIYQAGNWVYVGKTTGASSYLVKGRKMHQRAVDCSVGSRKGLLRLPPSDKYKYLMPLDDEMRGRVKPLAKPYPKRPKQSNDAPGDQPGEGGVAPTRTLHSPVDQDE